MLFRQLKFSTKKVAHSPFLHIYHFYFYKEKGRWKALPVLTTFVFGSSAYQLSWPVTDQAVPSVYGRVSQISTIYLFLCVFYAMLRYKSFKIRVNCLIELIKIYENMVLTSFLDLFQPPSMRISLILHLNFVHIKQQQSNRFDSCTDPGPFHSWYKGYENSESKW